MYYAGIKQAGKKMAKSIKLIWPFFFVPQPSAMRICLYFSAVVV
ncbi:hypothetical protein GPLA_2869 [Paraglaciecola polaris LMG 21857]|uniref:Uncharacterized protein n=1 Tax=Paraglaciecola polaris LMG 21857 TaxID=1129793 RepID=K6ZYE6_9ALTE|nr:hypothetical protein GPLA_2869 [Paraglaciecola polaris LMG 21857]